MNLTHHAELKSLLERHGWRPQKRWGQNFLVSSRVVDAILRRAAGHKGILEVGPGPGVLTAGLSGIAERVSAVEIDPIAISALSETAPHARIFAGDALKVDLESLLLELPEPRAIVSNMPYHITGPLITRFTELRHHFSCMILMMQKEVGERIQAPAGNSDRGSLSVYIEARFTVDRVCNAPSGAFLPPPKVDSVVLCFTPKPLAIGAEHDRRFERLVRMGFAQPRKTLANNLGVGGEFPREAFAELGIDPSIRPHQLALEDWFRITSWHAAADQSAS